MEDYLHCLLDVSILVEEIRNNPSRFYYQGTFKDRALLDVLKSLYHSDTYADTSCFYALNDPVNFPLQEMNHPSIIAANVRMILRFESFKYLRFMNEEMLRRAFTFLMDEKIIPLDSFMEELPESYKPLMLEYFNLPRYKDHRLVNFNRRGMMKFIRENYTLIVPNCLNVINVLLAEELEILDYWLDLGYYQILASHSPDIISRIEIFGKYESQKERLYRIYIERVLRYFCVDEELRGFREVKTEDLISFYVDLHDYVDLHYRDFGIVHLKIAAPLPKKV